MKNKLQFFALVVCVCIITLLSACSNDPEQIDSPVQDSVFEEIQNETFPHETTTETKVTLDSIEDVAATTSPIETDPTENATIPTECDHNYTKDSVVKPTCTHNGYTIYKCVCGQSYTGDDTEKLNHDYDVVNTVAPTCTTTGYTVNKCKNCGDIYNNQETPVIDHSYKSTIVKPTCSNVGYTLHKCICGKSYKSDETEKIPHDYKTQIVHATCELNGYINNICTNCSYSYQEPNGEDKMGHDCSIQQATVEATCEDEGYTVYKCSRCKHTNRENIVPPIGHDYVTETIAPTKDNQGYDLHICSRCKDSYKDNYKDPVVKYEEVNETVYATSDVNIRKGPSTDYEKIGALSKGESITRVGIGENGWSKVKYKDGIAYVSSNYITTTKPVIFNDEGWPKMYTDETCTITIYKEWYKNAYVYAAHIQFTNYSRFGTACANGAYNNGYETTSHAAKRLGAIFAVNGCYSSPNLDYTVVRSGKIWNGSGRASFWCPAIYSYHNGKLLSAWDGSWSTPGISGGQIDQLVADGLVTDTFCFGPPSMFNGEIANSTDTSRAQRTFIGTNGNAGDIWVCVSDGRYNDGASAGLTFKEAAEYLKEKGCTFCVHLDGGGSSTMYFSGKVLNAASSGQRSVVDFVYFK